MLRRMTGYVDTIRDWLASTPKRSFVLYPILIVAIELILREGRLLIDPWGVPLLFWGFLQYRLCGNFRTGRGGGGPGFQKPPDRIVDSGLYGYLRNPMYLGHLIFYAGLAATFHSLAAVALLLLHIPWFHARVLEDERHLEARFGEDYRAYKRRVKRWIPYLI
jgi:protein-S-isoprenylcysteine O-methyltransferase Ste14